VKARPFGALALFLSFLVPTLLAPTAEGAPPKLELVIDERTLGNTVPLKEWTSKRPSLADVNGDGRLELLSQNENGRVYVIDTRTGKALAELATRYPYGPDLGPFNGVVAADLDGDGAVEVVAVNRAAVVTAWRVEAANGSSDSLAFRFLWDRHLNQFHGKPTADAGAVLGDLDGDGSFELVIQTEEKGVYALRHNGSVLWALPEWGGNAEAKLADVNRDGALDAVFFTDGGIAYAVDGPTGRILWKYELRHRGVWPGSIPSPGVVADVDGDGRVEVAACARNVENATESYAPGAPYYRQHHFVLFLARENRSIWREKPSWGNPLCSAYLLGHDVDGDGKVELFGMDWNTIGHKPGNWAVTGRPHVFAFRHDGRELWHATTDHGNAKPHIALADWDGDGKQDVVAYGRGRLIAYDALTGAPRGELWLSTGDVKQGPLFADLDGDGTLEVVVAVVGAKNAFLVYDLGPRSTPPAWPGWDLPIPDPPGEPPRPSPGVPDATAPPPEGAGPTEATKAPGPRERGDEPPRETVLPLLLVVAALLLVAAGRRP